MNCLHDDFELTAEDLDTDTERMIYTITQHFICLECGCQGEREYTMPIEINWEDPHQTKLDLE
jgi:hypothetical protein